MPSCFRNFCGEGKRWLKAGLMGSPCTTTCILELVQIHMLVSLLGMHAACTDVSR